MRRQETERERERKTAEQQESRRVEVGTKKVVTPVHRIAGRLHDKVQALTRHCLCATAGQTPAFGKHQRSLVRATYQDRPCASDLTWTQACHLAALTDIQSASSSAAPPIFPQPSKCPGHLYLCQDRPLSQSFWMHRWWPRSTVVFDFLRKRCSECSVASFFLVTYLQQTVSLLSGISEGHSEKTLHSIDMQSSAAPVHRSRVAGAPMQAKCSCTRMPKLTDPKG